MQQFSQVSLLRLNSAFYLNVHFYTISIIVDWKLIQFSKIELNVIIIDHSDYDNTKLIQK